MTVGVCKAMQVISCYTELLVRFHWWDVRKILTVYSSFWNPFYPFHLSRQYRLKAPHFLFRFVLVASFVAGPSSPSQCTCHRAQSSSISSGDGLDTPSLAWRHPPLDLPGQPWLNVLVVPFAIVGYIDWKFTGNIKYV